MIINGWSGWWGRGQGAAIPSKFEFPFPIVFIQIKIL